MKGYFWGYYMKDVKEYRYFEIIDMMKTLETFYDIVRIVDPEECRTISIDADGSICTGDFCFDVWSSEHRCSNCTSLKACRTNRTFERSEYYQGKRFDIHSMPIVILLSDNIKFSCVMELITAEDIDPSEENTHFEKQNGNSEYLLLHDDMTGLYNYEGFLRTSRMFMTQHHEMEYVIAVADVRGFKILNAQLGREKGNEILVAISKMIRENLPKEAIVGRIFADRYAICVPSALFAEKKLKDMISGMGVHLDDLEYRLILHFGLYRVHNNDLPIPFMIDRATMAMRKIHKKGESEIAWFDEQILNEVMYEQEVISGFEQNLLDSQFQMYLQPQVDDYGQMKGAEALVRWKRDDGTIVAPSLFVSVLEEAGVVFKLDQFMWQQAVKQLKCWQDRGILDTYISVNISPRDFCFLDIPAVLHELCKEYGVPAGRLHVEITETAIMEQQDVLIEVICKLHEYGFLVEIDDFGKGSSSLCLLKDVDADVIKIDMDFLRETENRTKSRVILEAVVSMANKLDMEIITEGVETTDQLEHLKRIGCRCFQGFYYSKPISVGEFEKKYFGKR